MINEEYKVIDSKIEKSAIEEQEAHKIKVSATKLKKIHRFMIDISPYNLNNSKEEVKFEDKIEVEKVKGTKEQDLPFGNFEEHKTVFNDHKPDFDEQEIKARIAGNYKNLAKFENKEEKKQTEEKINKVTEADFEKLLTTNLTIMSDKINMFNKVYNEKKAKLKDAKLERDRLSDSFQKLSSKEQEAKASKEAISKRTEMMRNKKLFEYLETSDEDRAIIDAAELANESLQNYYQLNMEKFESLNTTIEQIQAEKEGINDLEKKVRLEIEQSSKDLSKYMNENAPLLEKIIKLDNQYNDTEKEMSLVKNEYEKVIKEEQEVNPVQINPVVNEANYMQPNAVIMPNAMENFKKVTAVASNGEQVMGIENGLRENNNLGVRAL